MFLDVPAFDDFYANAVGTATSTAIKAGLREVWPNLRGQHCLGIGYAFPYLEIFENEAASTAAITPARLGIRRWMHGDTNCSALANLKSLPIANAAYDRILMIHAFEFTRDREAFLEEVIRALSPSGEVALIVANRAGSWARGDTTPFGHGEPFTRRQLKRLIEANGLELISARTLLFPRPSQGLASMSWGRKLERVGSKLWPGLGGLVLITAKKQHLEEVKVRKGVLKVSPAVEPTRS